jgi:hypothetical protein
MSIEQLFSHLTRYLGTKKHSHRTESGFQTFWSYLVIALNVIAAIPDRCSSHSLTCSVTSVTRRGQRLVRKTKEARGENANNTQPRPNFERRNREANHGDNKAELEEAAALDNFYQSLPHPRYPTLRPYVFVQLRSSGPTRLPSCSSLL